MQLNRESDDYFDQHRKDHSSRPIALPLALAVSAVLWVVVISALIRIF